MSMIRWEPFGELMDLRRSVDKLFEEMRPFRFFEWPEMTWGSMFPALDMYETDDSLVIKAALPGVKLDDVEINITGDTLTIRGEVKAAEEVKKESYHRQERRYGAFRRAVSLPMGLKVDKADAVFENGVLTLSIPKAEEVKPKTIKVQLRGAIEGKKKEEKAA